MSYDVSIGDKSFNYTWNMSRFFYDHMPEGGMNALHGKTGKEAVSIISDVISSISDSRFSFGNDHEFCKKYDPPNGWGSTIGAIIFLANIMTACSDNPRKKVSVS